MICIKVGRVLDGRDLQGESLAYESLGTRGGSLGGESTTKTRAFGAFEVRELSREVVADYIGIRSFAPLYELWPDILIGLYGIAKRGRDSANGIGVSE